VTEDDIADRLRQHDDDAPPAALLAAARQAFSWRSVDVTLCPPSYDSLLDDALTSVRGDGDARLLSFVGPDVSVDVEVSSEGESRSVVGQVTPAEQAQVTVRHGGVVESTVQVDSLGRFSLDDVRPGAMSIRCFVPSRRVTLHTDWVLV
jgi:hypothetical protein